MIDDIMFCWFHVTHVLHFLIPHLFACSHHWATSILTVLSGTHCILLSVALVLGYGLVLQACFWVMVTNIKKIYTDCMECLCWIAFVLHIIILCVDVFIISWSYLIFWREVISGQSFCCTCVIYQPPTHLSQLIFIPHRVFKPPNQLISSRQSARGMFFAVSIHDTHDTQTKVLDHPTSVSPVSNGIQCILAVSSYYKYCAHGG